MNKKIVIFLIIMIMVLAGGILVWQFWPKKIERSAVEMPEEVIKNKNVDWKIYKNEEYGFEIQHPSYIKIERQKEVGELHPRQFKSWKLRLDDYKGVSLDNVLWLWMRVYNTEDYSVYDNGRGYVIYDPITTKWHLTDQFTLGDFNHQTVQRIEQYSPDIFTITKEGFPVYGGFDFSDVGMFSDWHPIIHPERKLIIEFSIGFSANDFDMLIIGSGLKESEQQDLSDKISKTKEDFLKIIQSIYFYPKKETGNGV